MVQRQLLSVNPQFGLKILLHYPVTITQNNLTSDKSMHFLPDKDSQICCGYLKEEEETTLRDKSSIDTNFLD